MANMLTDIELVATSLSGTTYPMVRILGMVEPETLGELDYFILERFRINRSDPVAMAAMTNAVTYQSVLYYMHPDLYMSTSFYLGSYDVLTDGVYTDVSTYFVNNIAYIIDTDTDISTYMYIYRIFYAYSGWTGSSSYVAGVQSIDVHEETAWVLGSPIPITTGIGQLYRTTEDGRIVLKGRLPGQLCNPRFRGPLEYEKHSARITSLNKSFQYISGKLDTIDSEISTLWSTINEMTEDATTTYRSSL